MFESQIVFIIFPLFIQNFTAHYIYIYIFMLYIHSENWTTYDIAFLNFSFSVSLDKMNALVIFILTLYRKLTQPNSVL